MNGTWLLARRNLARNRVRLLVSVGGVALALSLTLALDAIYAGVANQLTAYIDRAGADVWVSQAGVRNLHMVASWLPDSVTEEVRAVARKAGVGLGDPVTILGGEARIVGLSEGTASLVNSVAFVSFEDFRSMRGDASVVSYVLVRIASDASPQGIAAEIERRVAGVTAQSSTAFSVEERRLVTDMSADVIAIMNVVGFVVGLAVVALTVYVATLARRREFGALKALGARSRFLYGVVLVQASLSVALAFLVGLAFTGLLALVVPMTGVDLELAIGAASLVKVGLFAAVIAGLAAILPIRQIAGLDPAVVFRRGAAL